MDTKFFTMMQIERLKNEYGKIERISLKAGDELSDKVRNMPDTLVWQLALLKPRIPFVTPLANNEKIRRSQK